VTLRALIFDVDGTLAETEEVHRAAFNAAFAEAGLPWSWTVENYRILLRTTGGKERIAAYLAAEPSLPRLSVDQIAGLHRTKTAHYLRLMGEGAVALRPGVQALIDRARDRGVRLALCTTTTPANVEALSQAVWGTGAAQQFPVIVAGDEVAAKKPAPDAYVLALSRLGIGPEGAIAVEDSANGILAARAAGLRVAATPSIYSRDDDFGQATWVWPDLRAQTIL
jgi:HAD superfamily hydrolase (TIGR01509 family)